ncbi:MAG: type II secretion system major pseudopilin GspG [Planctomycetota bacterium]|jgi:general secretion pathway protein G
MRRDKTKDRGFTIVELLVVILIISMLAAFVAPRMFSGLGKAKRDIAKAKMANIEGALLKFYTDCERYPDQSEGLEVLVVAPADVEDKWNGPYLKQSELLDPWKNPYLYVEEGEINPGSFDLISYGADGQEGGEGDDEDIYND